MGVHPASFTVELGLPCAPVVRISAHAALRLQQRALPLETLVAAMRTHADRVERALDEARKVPEGIQVRCHPVALVLGWSNGLPLVLTTLWAIPGVPAHLHHLPTGIEGAPVLCVTPPAFEHLIEHGIDPAEVLAALRAQPRKFLAAVSLATAECAIRFTAAPYLFALGRVQDYPNLLAVHRA